MADGKRKPARRYMHGTKKSFTPGQAILPRSQHHGGANAAPVGSAWTERADAADWVYVTTDLNGAWLYAHDAWGDGDPVVYEVFPMSEVEHDPEHSKEMPAFRCRSAVVLGRIRGEAITPEQARALWVPENLSDRLKPFVVDAPRKVVKPADRK
jgi:hypothetical protein